MDLHKRTEHFMTIIFREKMNKCIIFSTSTFCLRYAHCDCEKNRAQSEIN